jgi:hypothetical protein
MAKDKYEVSKVNDGQGVRIALPQTAADIATKQTRCIYFNRENTSKKYEYIVENGDKKAIQLETVLLGNFVEDITDKRTLRDNALTEDKKTRLTQVLTTMGVVQADQTVKDAPAIIKDFDLAKLTAGSTALDFVQVAASAAAPAAAKPTPTKPAAAAAAVVTGITEDVVSNKGANAVLIVRMDGKTAEEIRTALDAQLKAVPGATLYAATVAPTAGGAVDTPALAISVPKDKQAALMAAVADIPNSSVFEAATVRVGNTIVYAAAMEPAAVAKPVPPAVAKKPPLTADHVTGNEHKLEAVANCKANDEGWKKVAEMVAKLTDAEQAQVKFYAGTATDTNIYIQYPQALRPQLGDLVPATATAVAAATLLQNATVAYNEAKAKLTAPPTPVVHYLRTNLESTPENWKKVATLMESVKIGEDKLEAFNPPMMTPHVADGKIILGIRESSGDPKDRYVKAITEAAKAPAGGITLTNQATPPASLTDAKTAYDAAKNPAASTALSLAELASSGRPLTILSGMDYIYKIPAASNKAALQLASTDDRFKLAQLGNAYYLTAPTEISGLTAVTTLPGGSKAVTKEDAAQRLTHPPATVTALGTQQSQQQQNPGPGPNANAGGRRPPSRTDSGYESADPNDDDKSPVSPQQSQPRPQRPSLIPTLEDRQPYVDGGTVGDLMKGNVGMGDDNKGHHVYRVTADELTRHGRFIADHADIQVYPSGRGGVGDAGEFLVAVPKVGRALTSNALKKAFEGEFNTRKVEAIDEQTPLRQFSDNDLAAIEEAELRATQGRNFRGQPGQDQGQVQAPGVSAGQVMQGMRASAGPMMAVAGVMLTAAGLFFPPFLLLGPLLTLIGLGKMGADEARGGGGQQQQAAPDAAANARIERMEEQITNLTRQLENSQRANETLREQSGQGQNPNQQTVTNILTALAPLPKALETMGPGQESTAVQNILTQVLAQLTQLNAPPQAARGNGNNREPSRDHGQAPTGAALTNQAAQMAAGAQGAGRQPDTTVTEANPTSVVAKKITSIG